MKFWVKIVVALCVVLVASFATWAFFFREKDNVVVYNQISEMLEYKESTGLIGKLEDLEKFDYVNKDKKITIDETLPSGAEIVKLRKNLLSDEVIEVYDTDDNLVLSYNSYEAIDDYAFEFIEYMLPYLNTVEGSGSLIRKIKKSTKNYINTLKETNTSIDLVVECQNTITGTEIEYDVLYGKYNDLRLDFRALLSEASNLMTLMISYYKDVKDDNMLTTTYLTLNDAFARTLKPMTTTALISELDYANDLYYVTSKLDKIKNNDNIFVDGYTELNYLNAYNNLINRNEDLLNMIFSKKYIEKKKMADNQNLSEVPENKQIYVVYILNVLGY